eukprot:1829282-Lingulodinium_polyedra.AAC.1
MAGLSSTDVARGSGAVDPAEAQLSHASLFDTLVPFGPSGSWRSALPISCGGRSGVCSGWSAIA